MKKFFLILLGVFLFVGHSYCGRVELNTDSSNPFADQYFSIRSYSYLYWSGSFYHVSGEEVGCGASYCVDTSTAHSFECGDFYCSADDGESVSYEGQEYSTYWGELYVFLETDDSVVGSFDLWW